MNENETLLSTDTRMSQSGTCLLKLNWIREYITRILNLIALSNVKRAFSNLERVAS